MRRTHMKTLTMLGALSLPLSAFSAGAESAKVGFEYAASALWQSNQGFQGKDGEGKEPKTDRSFGGMAIANLKVDSSFGDRNHVHFKYDMVGGKVKAAHVQRKLNNNIDLQIGKIKVNQLGNNGAAAAGYDGFSNSRLVTKIWSMGATTTPTWHGQYTDGVGVHYSAGNMKAAFQLLNKPKVDAPVAGTVKNEESGMDFSLHAEMALAAGVTPMFDYVTYDENAITTVGAKFAQNRISGYLDYNMYKEVNHSTTGDGAAKKFDSNYAVNSTSMALELHYDMGNMKPFFAFNNYTVTDKKTGGKTGDDVKANSATAATPDNNSQTIAFGVELAKFTEQFRPRITVANHSGKWYKKAGETADESRSQMDISVAIFGEL